MKKILSLILVAVLLTAVLVGCGGAKNGVDAIQKSGKLTVYTEAGFAPYEFYYNNEIVGVDMEIMKAVAAKLGVEMVVTDVAFDTIVSGVQAGKANCGAAGMTINDERKESVDFSIPYSSTEQYLIVPADNDTLKTVEDLKGKIIGVQEGTTSDFLVSDLIADKTLDGSSLTPYKTPAAAAAVVGTKVDAVVTDKLTAEIIVSNNAGLKTFALVKADGTVAQEVEEYGICIAKGNEDLLAIINEVIDGLLKDGSIEKWVTEYSAKATEVGA